MSHQFTTREIALLMAREIDHQESAPDDDEYIGDWIPTHSCGGAGDPTCAACWMHGYDRADGVVAEEPEWEYGVGWRWDGRMIAFSTTTRAAAEKYIERHPEDDDFGSHILVQRQPEKSAGAWVPVKQKGAEQ